ncbi:DUF1702 family protein [Polymorphospora rubra]|uniref:DUF1702 family protein n=1 Tax=Polymorphospora rubra TaxID=338584 RepID=UPI0033E04F8E
MLQKANKPVRNDLGAFPVQSWPLPMRMADFEHRGFRCTRPEARALLERHARSFLTGFNLAARNRGDLHGPLAAVTAEERGFAYEGAAMFASMLDVVPARRRALSQLLAGPGDGYTHLIHVGAGWTFAPMRLPLPRLPVTPLLRWLALDGAGFAETFFGGPAALTRRCARHTGERWEAVVAGCGRALWFLESADVDGIAAAIERQPFAARAPLWSGIGLACGYAGGVSPQEMDRLPAAAGVHAPHLRQGVTFAAGARVRAGIVPDHTTLACQRLVGVSAETAAGWTDTDAEDLLTSTELPAYMEWRARLRRRCDARF